jgi:hypothetical protein
MSPARETTPLPGGCPCLSILAWYPEPRAASVHLSRTKETCHDPSHSIRRLVWHRHRLACDGVLRRSRIGGYEAFDAIRQSRRRSVSRLAQLRGHDVLPQRSSKNPAPAASAPAAQVVSAGPTSAPASGWPVRLATSRWRVGMPRLFNSAAMPRSVVVPAVCGSAMTGA